MSLDPPLSQPDSSSSDSRDSMEDAFFDDTAHDQLKRPDWKVGSSPIPQAPQYRICDGDGDGGFLGEGAQGSVWAAEDEKGNPVAIKFVNLEHCERVKNVLEILSHLEPHPNVLQVIGKPYELAEGLAVVMPRAKHSLFAYVKCIMWKGHENLDVRLLNLLRGAAAGVDYLNDQGIRHRDIKPANLLEYADGTVVVGDPDLLLKTDKPIAPGSLRGTEGYVAAETLGTDGISFYTRQSDQVGLAATYVTLRTGRVDGVIADPRELAIVEKARHEDPTRRHETCSRFVEELFRLSEIRVYCQDRLKSTSAIESPLFGTNDCRLSMAEFYIGRLLSPHPRPQGETLRRDYVDHQALPEPPESEAKWLAGLREHPYSGIAGDAGMGKSTFLRHMEWMLTRDFLSGKSKWVPVFLDLGTIKSGDLESLPDDLSAFLSLCGVQHISGGAIDDLRHAGQLLLLVDGLDEAPQERSFWNRLGSLLNRASGAIVAGRPWAFAVAKLPNLHMPVSLLTLDPEDIYSYVAAYFSNSNVQRDLIHSVIDRSPPLTRLLRRPLMLAIFCFLHATDKGASNWTPRNEADLLGNGITRLIERRNLPLAPMLEWLGQIAWEQIAQGSQSVSFQRLATSRPSDILMGVQDLTADAIIARSGIMNPHPRVPSEFVFAEESFKDYLAGYWVGIQSWDYVREWFSSHAWKASHTHALEFVAAVVWQKNPEHGLQLARWLLAERDQGHDDMNSWLAMLAARVLGLAESMPTVQDPNFQDIGQRLSEVLVPQYCQRIPGRQIGPAAVCDYYRRLEASVHDLLKVASSHVVKALEAELGGIGALVAARLLVGLGQQQTVIRHFITYGGSSVLHALFDDFESLFQITLTEPINEEESLGAIEHARRWLLSPGYRNEVAIDKCYKILSKAPSQDLEDWCIRYLGKHSGETKLYELLWNRWKHRPIWMGDIYALGGARDPELKDSVIQLFGELMKANPYSRNPLVFEEICQSLGRLGVSQAANLLIPLLRIYEGDFKKDCGRALSATGAETAKTVLEFELRESERQLQTADARLRWFDHRCQYARTHVDRYKRRMGITSFIFGAMRYRKDGDYPLLRIEERIRSYYKSRVEALVKRNELQRERDFWEMCVRTSGHGGCMRWAGVSPRHPPSSKVYELLNFQKGAWHYVERARDCVSGVGSQGLRSIMEIVRDAAHAAVHKGVFSRLEEATDSLAFYADTQCSAVVEVLNQHWEARNFNDFRRYFKKEVVVSHKIAIGAPWRLTYASIWTDTKGRYTCNGWPERIWELFAVLHEAGIVMRPNGTAAEVEILRLEPFREASIK